MDRDKKRDRYREDKRDRKSDRRPEGRKEYYREDKRDYHKHRPCKHTWDECYYNPTNKKQKAVTFKKRHASHYQSSGESSRDSSSHSSKNDSSSDSEEEGEARDQAFHADSGSMDFMDSRIPHCKRLKKLKEKLGKTSPKQQKKKMKLLAETRQKAGTPDAKARALHAPSNAPPRKRVAAAWAAGRLRPTAACIVASHTRIGAAALRRRLGSTPRRPLARATFGALRPRHATS